MTPFAHYLAAEDLLTKAADTPVDSLARKLTAQAQVHATLATFRHPDDYDLDPRYEGRAIVDRRNGRLRRFTDIPTTGDVL